MTEEAHHLAKETAKFFYCTCGDRFATETLFATHQSLFAEKAPELAEASLNEMIKAAKIVAEKSDWINVNRVIIWLEALEKSSESAKSLKARLETEILRVTDILNKGIKDVEEDEGWSPDNIQWRDRIEGQLKGLKWAFVELAAEASDTPKEEG